MKNGNDKSKNGKIGKVEKQETPANDPAVDKESRRMGVVLAKAFADIAADGDVVETKAERMLTLVRSNGITDEKSFSAAVRLAYKANGWRMGRGRPRRGSEDLEPVPATVKQYVSQVRAAFRLGLDGRSMRTFSALRRAVSEARAGRRQKARSKDPNLVGLHTKYSDRLIKAPMHDLAVVYGHLDTPRLKARLIARVNALVTEFKGEAVFPHLRLVEMEKKAA